MLKIFDDYKVSVALILLLLIVAILVVPFAAKAIPIGSIRIPVTPILVMGPILQGIIYAIVVSYETPKMTEEAKRPFRVVKAINFAFFYLVTISAIIYAFGRF